MERAILNLRFGKNRENWQIHSATKDYPKEELFGLVGQMRRAAVSVPSNLAEGCGRNHIKESVQFFSLQEVLFTNWKLNVSFPLIKDISRKNN